MGCQELNQTTIFYQDFSDKDNNKLTEQAAEKNKNIGVGCHFLSKGSSHPGIEPESPVLDSLPLSYWGNPQRN